MSDRSLPPSSDLEPSRRLHHDAYTIAIICPMGDEMSPVLALLDETHETLSTSRDQNAYKLGMMGRHNVVIAGMPMIGNNAASMVVTQLLNDFGRIRFALLVGVGGGIPDEDYEDDDLIDIRLGDVVVSESRGTFGGVIQFDRGKSTTEGFVTQGHLNKPPHVLAANVETLKAVHNLHGNAILRYFDDMLKRFPGMEGKYSYPGSERDRLFEASYTHSSGKTCKKCDLTQTIERSQRKPLAPQIHYGTIGSSNMVIENTQKRDELRGMGILCVEMEAAGLMDAFPCLVVRGISDYADSHKNKRWQPYAAAMAAAYMKELLFQIPTDAVQRTQSITNVLHGVSAKVDQIDHNTRRIEGQNQNAEEAKILEWLSSKDINFSSLQNVSQETHTAGTGQWLLDGEQYQNWRSRSPGLMWIHGAAGCGKTILCSTVIRDLQTHVSSLAYWYFRFDDITSQDVSKMLRSLIRQLSFSPLPAGIRALHDQHNQRGSEPSLKELTTVLDNTVDTLKKDVYIVFDALDECPHKDKKGQRDQLVRCIANLMKTGSNLHLLVTSRPEPDIRRELGGITSWSLDIERLIQGDVEAYVKHALEEPRLTNLAEDVKDEIKNKLLEYEERHAISHQVLRFRWADLQIKRFAQCPSLEKLRAAMASIPKDLETSYHQAFEAITDDVTSEVTTIMKWLAVSFEPLSASQIAAVVGFRNSDYVLDICSTLLVTIIEEDTAQIIKLAHFSVKEFLIVQLHENSTHWYKFSSELANRDVAFTALQALLERKAQLNPIIHYAARSWPRHATEGLKRSDNVKLEKQINLLFNIGYTERFLSWLKIYDPDWYYYCTDRYIHFVRAGALYYASLLGFETVVHDLWVNDSQLLKDEGRFGNALNAAAIRGNVAIVRWIMQKCQSPTKFLNLVRVAGRIDTSATECFSEIFDRASDLEITEEVVVAAAENWRSSQEVMQLLLERKGDEMQITEAVTWAAAGNEHSGHKVTQLLLERKGDEMQITEEVIMAAAGNEHNGYKVMQLLLKRKGDEMQITKEVVMAAAGNRHSGHEVMQLLLERKGDEMQITQAVIQAAVENMTSGHKVLALLVEEGADLNAPSENGVTPLNAAATKGYIEAVKLLLENGIDSSIFDNDGCTPLNNASFYGHVEVVDLLIQNGADPAIAGNNGWTPLSIAAKNGQVEVVDLLLKRGADTSIPDLYGATCFTLAAKEGHLNVVQRLLDDGCGWKMPNTARSDALQGAILGGYSHIEAYLLMIGAEIPDDVYGISALFRE